jgi:hypothetical protein
MNAYQPQEMLTQIGRMLAHLPGVEQRPSYQTPAFFVDKKMICRFKEDGETLVVYHEDRDELINANPEIYFFTEHYQNHPYVLVKLTLVSLPELKELLIHTYRLRALKRTLAKYQAATA